MSATALGEETTMGTTLESITVEDVWQFMPDEAGGPEWRSLIEDALAWWRENADDEGYDRVDAVEYYGTFADQWVPASRRDQVERFNALGLWFVGFIEDWDAVGRAETYALRGILGLAAEYLYLAANFTARAVHRAIEARS